MTDYFSYDPMDDGLSHYGVLGMKWGVRRSQAELDRAAGRTPKGSKSAKASNSSGKEKSSGGKLRKVASNAIASHKAKKAAKAAEEAEREANSRHYKVSLRKNKAPLQGTTEIDVRLPKETLSEAVGKQPKGVRRRSPRHMTDAELNSAIDRLSREKRYSDLKKQTRRGARYVDMVERMVQSSAETVGKQVLNYYFGRAVNQRVGVDVVNVKKANDDQANEDKKKAEVEKEIERRNNLR